MKNGLGLGLDEESKTLMNDLDLFKTLMNDNTNLIKEYFSAYCCCLISCIHPTDTQTISDICVTFVVIVSIMANAQRDAAILWPPYVIGQAIYIFILWFLLSFVFPCLISAVGDWMSTILPHMVWP